ncbi:MAG: DUF1392 family protein [Nostoc sp.]
MIDHINALQTSWYLSPPWRKTIRNSQFAIRNY